MEWISSSTVLYILAVNGITFLAFGLDKYKAVHHRFRIREATLFTLALWAARPADWRECIAFTIKPGSRLSRLACR